MKFYGRRVLSFGMILMIIGFSVCLLVFPYVSASAAKEGMRLCFDSVLPALFPFMTAALLLTKLGFAEITSRFLDGFMRKVFNVSGSCAPAFLLGTLSGFPVGAKVISSIYSQGGCSRSDAEKTLVFCNAAGPAFVIGTVGASLWGSGTVGYILWAVQIVCSVLTGILFGRISGKTEIQENRIIRREPVKFFRAFSESVAEGISGVLSVCGFVIFFSVVVAVFDKIGLFSVISEAVGGLLSADYGVVRALSAGVLELTTGVFMLSEACAGAGISAQAGMALTAALLGWTGISVQMQIFSCIHDSGLSGKLFVAGRVFQSVISSALAWGIFSLYSAYAPASSISGTHVFSGIGCVKALGVFFALCAAIAALSRLSAFIREKARG